MIDAEMYMGKLLKQSYDALDPQPMPRPNITPDVDMREVKNLPQIVWSLTGSGQTGNGEGLWFYTLHLLSFGDGMDQAKAAMKSFYDIVHAWDANPASTVIDVDGSPVCVAWLEDEDLPSRFPSADIPGRNVVQYGGSFPLALRG